MAMRSTPVVKMVCALVVGYAYQDKKQAILHAALMLFSEQGYHGTATGAIARQANGPQAPCFITLPTNKPC